jgi:hypothetical protein
MFIPPPHDQQIFFKDGTERWIRNVVHIERGHWFHLITEQGIEYIIPPENIQFVRVYKVGKARQYGEPKTIDNNS